MKKNVAISSLAMAMALGSVMGSTTSEQPVKEKPKQPSKPKHPFLNNPTPLFVFLLEDETINAEDVFNLKKYISVPVEMIPFDEAFKIVDYINKNRKSSYRNMNMFETEVEVIGKVYTTRVIAVNAKNAKKKVVSKLQTVNTLLSEK